MATKNGQIKSNSNNDAAAIIYAVNQMDAILEMLKDVK
jgi:hypothetical protein